MAGSMVIGFDYIEQKLMILLQTPHFASEIVINIRYQTKDSILKHKHLILRYELSVLKHQHLIIK